MMSLEMVLVGMALVGLDLDLDLDFLHRTWLRSQTHRKSPIYFHSWDPSTLATRLGLREYQLETQGNHGL
jgi:hypothetical protein